MTIPIAGVGGEGRPLTSVTVASAAPAWSVAASGAAGENVNLNLAQGGTARRIALVADAPPVVRLSTVTELAGKR